MHFNPAQREVVLKVVYYGPPFSGKTTNIQAVHAAIQDKKRGRLTVLDTADDRTLFFDMLPVMLDTSAGYRIKLKLFTVPGQVIHAATRRLVLSGSDGVVFVADSQIAEAKKNNEYWHGMRHYLGETGIDPDAMPTVVQFNKRDLQNIRTDEELEKLRQHSVEPICPAIAVRGIGVRETLVALFDLLFADLDKRFDFQKRFNITCGEFVGRLFDAQGVDASGGAS